MSDPNDHESLDDGVEDDGAWTYEVRSRRRRRKPRLKRKRKDLEFAPGEKPSDPDQRFADPDMQALYLRGYFDTLIGEVKGGKEATVFLVGRGSERLAAKVYADVEARSFRDDSRYWTDVYIGDDRIVKAMRQGSKAGRRAKQSIWAMREYVHLWRLFEAGVPVPKPAVGPEPSVLAEAGSVVLMEYVGDGDEPAGRLSDGRLDAASRRVAFEQAVAILCRLTELGLVHGDYSTYNLLWHDGAVRVIDVPQMMMLEGNRNGVMLLERDLRSLATSFRRLGVAVDEGALRTQVFARLPRG